MTLKLTKDYDEWYMRKPIPNRRKAKIRKCCGVILVKIRFLITFLLKIITPTMAAKSKNRQLELGAYVSEKTKSKLLTLVEKTRFSPFTSKSSCSAGQAEQLSQIGPESITKNNDSTVKIEKQATPARPEIILILEDFDPSGPTSSNMIMNKKRTIYSTSVE